MRFFKFHIFPLFILFFLGPWSLVLSPRSVVWALPSPQGYVNDFASILNQDTKRTLENLASRLEKETSIELAIITVPSLEGETVEDYAVKLFETWKIGKKERDNGLLFLVALFCSSSKSEQYPCGNYRYGNGAQRPLYKPCECRKGATKKEQQTAINFYFINHSYFYYSFYPSSKIIFSDVADKWQ